MWSLSSGQSDNHRCFNLDLSHARLPKMSMFSVDPAS